MSVGSDISRKLKNLEVPVGKGDDKVLTIIMGVINCFFFGIGMIILGIVNNDTADLLIGVCQLLIPFVGWVWAIVWGILIVARSL